MGPAQVLPSLDRVELQKPLGMVLEELEDGGVKVLEMDPAGNAARSGVILLDDQVCLHHSPPARRPPPPPPALRVLSHLPRWTACHRRIDYWRE